MDNDLKKKAKETFKDLWSSLPGKAVIISAGGLALIGFSGLVLKVSTFTMNRFKDFRDAYQR